MDAFRVLLGNHAFEFRVRCTLRYFGFRANRPTKLSPFDVCMAALVLGVQSAYPAVVTRVNWSVKKKPVTPEL
jgi:hypothetical protein